ncbi:MAG: peptide-methionine (S)-S-oxide reductase MsrA [Nitrosomonas sp.]|nr:peptide-methionine (S)-S-oxide reductase MsrA [Nitrosomonas sp.]MCP5252398.1 peptide-methionine (S)-S-oxide reductase MsrA [Burkholderiales bacterium]MCP5291317.1 peptide-methionine (S)-S-oxide reductase MsrA [Burkholderiales bacterium]MDR4519371.1 peptide-methionine (S)-S-oxide reductase MsrA [Nitrosomonas sp.]HQU63018.1 peptide-methionine (S)-S-oxide reductase MsrA [Nitrosomonas sp.]
MLTDFIRFKAVFAALSLPILITACQFSSETIAGDQTIPTAHLDTAIFAGGCFWCTESDLDKLPGVISTTPGYIGGTVNNPTYEQVVTGRTGHVEAVRIQFDKTVTDFETLLQAFWRTIDPVFPDGQFCDIGPQYRSAIFYLTPEQNTAAQASKNALAVSGRFELPIVTDILPATMFYPAEDYHQDYYLKNPANYAQYRNKCGRDARLKQLWGDEASTH